LRARAPQRIAASYVTRTLVSIELHFPQTYLCLMYRSAPGPNDAHEPGHLSLSKTRENLLFRFNNYLVCTTTVQRANLGRANVVTLFNTKASVGLRNLLSKSKYDLST
jgi:hypothetical protein